MHLWRSFRSSIRSNLALWCSQSIFLSFLMNFCCYKVSVLYLLRTNSLKPRLYILFASSRLSCNISSSSWSSLSARFSCCLIWQYALWFLTSAVVYLPICDLTTSWNEIASSNEIRRFIFYFLAILSRPFCIKKSFAFCLYLSMSSHLSPPPSWMNESERTFSTASCVLRSTYKTCWSSSLSLWYTLFSSSVKRIE